MHHYITWVQIGHKGDVRTVLWGLETAEVFMRVGHCDSVMNEIEGKYNYHHFTASSTLQHHHTIRVWVMIYLLLSSWIKRCREFYSLYSYIYFICLFAGKTLIPTMCLQCNLDICNTPEDKTMMRYCSIGSYPLIIQHTKTKAIDCSYWVNKKHFSTITVWLKTIMWQYEEIK